MIHKALTILALFLLSFTLTKAQTTNPPNWTTKQLVEPSTLAAEIRDGNHLPYLISVGPGATIPASHHTGMASTPEGITALSASLDSLPKDTRVVIYCGCCPFEHCPNVRPAIDVLKQKGFTNYYLLNLPTNIKTDWISKGYPVVSE